MVTINMKQQEDFLAIEKKADFALKKCLESYKIDQIFYISDRYKIITENKAKTVDSLYSAILKLSENYFDFVPVIELEIFLGLIYEQNGDERLKLYWNNSAKYDKSLKSNIIKGFVLAGFIYHFVFEGKDEFVIPNEVIKNVCSRIGENGKHDYCGFDRFIDMGEILVSLYGIVDAEIFSTVWNNNFSKKKISVNETKKLFEISNYFASRYFIKDDCLLSLDLCDDELKEQLIEERKNKKIFIPTEKEISTKLDGILKPVESDWFVGGIFEYEGNNQHYVDFKNFIFEKFTEEEERNEILAAFMYFIKAGYLVSQIIDFMNDTFEFTKKFSGEKEIQEFMTLYSILNNSTHMWVNYGNSPALIHENSLVDFETPFDMKESLLNSNFQLSNEFLIVDKVGRNDPCPCGSGKKYKQCHGKNW